MVDHKWPYNENVSTPQSWGCPPRRAARHGGLGGQPRQELQLVNNSSGEAAHIHLLELNL